MTWIGAGLAHPGDHVEHLQAVEDELERQRLRLERYVRAMSNVQPVVWSE